ncbi:unnamed protein product [Owenia fusiformis]|uniref:Mediator of RNA polymerase II transcription subunit 14 n=1 Tax=Owenia fusiformis TaxID=6347 RepID=A0A8J1XJU9_OWEFU|nr:unnamed protein product [Owenia fusiformis]
MPPVDGQQLMQGGPQPVSGGQGTIPLGTLIDYIVQRTYHELTVLSELLPRKTDMERKIEIVQFAGRTRQLFIRLLALVKWASMAGKVDKCGVISDFLDRQAMFFVETADMLAKMARETLVHARLPNFSLPCAIDVLTTGSYPRLPNCIRDKIVPPDGITPKEKRETLLRLNQIIQHRLVTTDMPEQFNQLKIENGRVTFIVQHEFEASLTLMGDSSTIPWRLLDIDILVLDQETGDGKALVHSLQVNYIHQLVQSRLLCNDKPLHDLYNCLHSFCQSLQLEVLHSQAQRLIVERLGDHVRVEDYMAGKCLVLSYWRDPVKLREIPTTDTDTQKYYKVSVHINDLNPAKPLQVTHTPELSKEDTSKVGRAIKSNQLSIEKLLMQTIQVRSVAKLKELQEELEPLTETACEIKEIPSVLYVPLLEPCMQAENLCISVDILKGIFLPAIPQYGMEITDDLAEALNEESKDVTTCLSDLRCLLALKRCRKSVQHLPVTLTDRLPIVNMAGHQLEKLGKHKIFIKLCRQGNHYVVIDVKNLKTYRVELSYYLLHTLPSSFDCDITSDALDDIPMPFLRAGHMIKLDEFSCVHGSATVLQEEVKEERSLFTRKRKALFGAIAESQPKKTKTSPYLVPEVTQIITMCEERLPLLALEQELSRQDISTQGIQVDCNGTCLSLTVLELPDCVGCSKEVSDELKSALLSCKFRLQRKNARMWLVEYIFTNTPIIGVLNRDQGMAFRVYGDSLLTPETMQKTVQELIDDWNMIGRLYGPVLEFARYYNEPKTNMQSMCEVRNYNYRKLIIAYGPSNCQTITILWNHKEQKFTLQLGTIGPAISSNPQLQTLPQLERDFNDHQNIAQLLQVLHDTWSPLTSIAKLNTLPVLGLINRPNLAIASFTILPQSATHIRISFRNHFCIDINCRGSRLVAIRDGAYSLFDSAKVVDGFNPTPGLKAFLNIYVDDTATASLSRRRSTTEDDNPPSPTGIDIMDSFMTSQSHNTGSPANRAQKDAQGLRFNSPKTPPSNPHTPASPIASKLGQPGYSSSPAAAFPLSSPPSLSTIAPSPMMMAPSPGFLPQGSPGNILHEPSPGSFIPAPSPSSLGIHMPSPASTFISPHGMVEGMGGSPHPNLMMPSPGGGKWPGSPASVPNPSPAPKYPEASPGPHGEHSGQTVSRILPQRSWAASIPTLLSHDALNKILTPGPHPLLTPGVKLLPCCPLERFLGGVYLRKHMQRVVQSEENLHNVPSDQAGVIQFRTDTLQFRLALNPTNFQILSLKATPSQEYADQWNQEDIQILEKFFELKVACPPYKVNVLLAFSRLLTAPYRILKDCIQIMRLELYPDRGVKWEVRWCLTISPGSPPLAPAGTPAVMIKSKMLIMLQFTRVGVAVPPGTDPQTIVVPVLYDINTNITTVAEPKPGQIGGATSTPATMAVQQMLKRFTDFHQKLPDCSIFPAVREIMNNLVIPM